MLLAAATQIAFDAVGTAPELLDVSTLALHAGQDELLLLQRLLDGHHRLERLVLDARKAHGAARELYARRGDDEDRLAVVLDQLGCERRLVRQHGADVVRAGDVGRGEDRHHALGIAHRPQIQSDDLGVRLARNAEGGAERSRRLGQVVDIARLAGHVQRRAVVRQRLVHARHVFGFHGVISRSARGPTPA